MSDLAVVNVVGKSVELSCNGTYGNAFSKLAKQAVEVNRLTFIVLSQ